MADEVVIEELKRRLLPRSFVPCRLRLRSGEHLDIVRPFQVAIGRTRFTYLYPGRRGSVERRLASPHLRT